MAFDMRGELFGNRDELLREQSDRFLESLGLITEISLVDCLNSQISALQSENAQLKAQLTWRPVTTPPKHGQIVFIMLVDGWEVAQYLDGDFYIRDEGNYDLMVVEVFGWLPIPSESY